MTRGGEWRIGQHDEGRRVARALVLGFLLGALIRAASVGRWRMGLGP
jgi:hypothetical protein